MQEMSDEIHNFEYEILGEYKGYIKKVKIRIFSNLFSVYQHKIENKVY